MDEFGLIHKYFSPLARDFAGSLNLTDDAALIDVPDGHQLVVTKDAICEGIHFFEGEDAALIAKKLLRTNLSDLAAKGATPHCYFLAGMLPKGTNEEWVARFAAGLDEDQKTYGIQLAGGDTTSTKHGLGLSLTAIGTVPKGAALLRNGAKIGDDIYVSGTIGDGALGLLSLQKKIENDAYLKQRYHLPEPQLDLGLKLRGLASSCMDISDGLVQDMGHICRASNVGAILQHGFVPLSESAARCVKDDATLWEVVLTGGDDYELLFTASKEKSSTLSALPVTKIGEVVEEKNVRVLDENGEEVTLKQQGFRHFGQ